MKDKRVKCARSSRATALLGACIIIMGTFATTSQAYAENGAQNEIIPLPPGTQVDNTECGGELVDVSGDVHVVSQVTVRMDGSFHVVQHVNFIDVKGVGETTGNDYRVPNTFNSPSNFDVDATGSANAITSFHLVSVGPDQSTSNLTVQAVFHLTVNSNGQITSNFEKLRAVCTD